MTNGKSKLSDAVLDEMEYGELTGHITEAIKVLRRKAYGEGYAQGKFDEAMENTEGFRALDVDVEDVFEKSEQERLDQRMDDLRHGQTDDIKYWAPLKAQERRDEIVERAKADVKERFIEGNHGVGKVIWNGDVGHCIVEFIVNKDKRTVVALIRRAYVFEDEVRTKGIAKCAPNDCFNVHIGKAIALRRALGLEVPDEYLNAPQPTEVRVGDDVKTTNDTFSMWGNGKVIRLEKPCAVRGYYVEDNSYNFLKDVKIIDDSRDEVPRE